MNDPNLVFHRPIRSTTTQFSDSSVGEDWFCSEVVCECMKEQVTRGRLWCGLGVVRVLLFVSACALIHGLHIRDERHIINSGATFIVITVVLIGTWLAVGYKMKKYRASHPPRADRQLYAMCCYMEQPSGSENDEACATRQTFGESEIAVPSAPSMQDQQATSDWNLETPDIIITGSAPASPYSPSGTSNPPPYAAVSDRSCSATPSGTPSPERPSGRGGLPPYEAVSSRPEDNPSFTGLPPPSYEEVITGQFTQIQPGVCPQSEDR